MRVGVRLRLAVLACFCFVACDQGEGARATRESERATRETAAAVGAGSEVPPAQHGVGTIKGRVTHTLDGPGRAHAPEEAFSTTTGSECTVSARDAWGKTTDARSAAETGAFEMRVPAGRYTVSFDACAIPSSCGETERAKPVEVTAGAVTEVSWDCVVHAK